MFWVALPVLGDLDTQVEVNSCPHQLLDLRAGSGAYFAQPGTAFVDHNALLTVALDVADRVHVDQIVVVRTRGHPVDHHGQRVWQLVTHPLERGLANRLGHQHLTRLGDTSHENERGGA